ncbi:hypothetical protein N7522_008814 [Penicillium canescens]|nr:hypothetical protein N7522_008814 [Penicillium canescens]
MAARAIEDPKIGRIHTTRDVGFLQYGDDKGDNNGTAANPSPKKPIEPSSGGGAASEPPNLEEEVKTPRNPIKQVQGLMQAPSMTPSEQAPNTSPSEPLLAINTQGQSSAMPITISSSPDPINTIEPT